MGIVPPSDQDLLGPAKLDEVDPGGVAYPQVMPGVGQSDVMGGSFERPVLAEMLEPLRLEDPETGGVNGHRVAADENSLIGPNVFPAEVVRADAVEERRQHDEDVEAGPALDVRQRPDGGQVGAGIAVVSRGLRNEGDVVLDAAAHAR